MVPLEPGTHHLAGRWLLYTRRRRMAVAGGAPRGVIQPRYIPSWRLETQTTAGASAPRVEDSVFRDALTNQMVRGWRPGLPYHLPALLYYSRQHT